jgi:hypothetical protein
MTLLEFEAFAFGLGVLLLAIAEVHKDASYRADADYNSDADQPSSSSYTSMMTLMRQMVDSNKSNKRRRDLEIESTPTLSTPQQSWCSRCGITLSKCATAYVLTRVLLLLLLYVTAQHDRLCRHDMSTRLVTRLFLIAWLIACTCCALLGLGLQSRCCSCWCWSSRERIARRRLRCNKSDRALASFGGFWSCYTFRLLYVEALPCFEHSSNHSL